MSKRKNSEDFDLPSRPMSHGGLADDHLCPSCGLAHPDNDPKLYTCPTCDKQAFDCCIAGNNCMCFDCEDASENA